MHGKANAQAIENTPSNEHSQIGRKSLACCSNSCMSSPCESLSHLLIHVGHESWLSLWLVRQSEGFPAMHSQC